MCAAALSRRCRAASVEGVDDLVDLLAARFPAVARSSLQHVAAAGWLEALPEEGLSVSEVSCTRDYSLPCPEAWVDGGDGKTCFAPLGYTGPCSEAIHFEEGATPEVKRRQASACGAQFPCQGMCTPDYSAPCPRGWVPEGVGCAAPAGYTESCVAHKSFGGFSWQEKRLWAEQCHVSWPCRSSQGSFANLGGASSLRSVGACNSDFAAECPEGWTKLGGTCVSPSAYRGPCSVAVPLGNLTLARKHVYSEVCQSPWPCATSLRR